jgi:hypothetical protein
MSHYVAVVILPKGTVDIEGEVDRLLAPFDEGLKVAPYEETCYCKGTEAEHDARVLVETETPFGPTYREPYNAVPVNARSDWEDFIRPYNDRVDELTKAHPRYDLPDSECEDCKGTGIATSTYNPMSKWDWYQIGGRWTGWIDGHNWVEVDPKAIAYLKKHAPYALVTPDGVWHSRGRMGWWGMSTGDETEEVWGAEFEEALAANLGHKAVAVDLHI